MELNKIYNGNSLDVLKTFDNESIDTIITDPPYGYSFMNKDWDKAVVSVDIWKQCLRVLKHGAFAAIMSSPRQDVLSRMICNLQDAGFRTDFTSIYWTYASGFPKAANISKLIDKRFGLKREVIGLKSDPRYKYASKSVMGVMTKDNTTSVGKFEGNDMFETKPTSKEAQELDGSYGGFQPKPAVEVVLIVMKPLSEKSYVDQALANGKGVTWLDSVRIPFQSENDFNSSTFGTQTDIKNNNYGTNRPSDGHIFNTNVKANPQGRFPANLLISDNVLDDGIIRKSGKMGAQTTRKNLKGYTGLMPQQTLNEIIGDSGSYSRFFDLDKWFDSTFPFLAVPKASSSEKNKGLDRWMPKEGEEKVKGNTHPTVKPLKLMSWLITLLSRPNNIVLDPFSGSGTTCLASRLLKRKYIGIELNKQYVDLSLRRISSFRTYIE